MVIDLYPHGAVQSWAFGLAVVAQLLLLVTLLIAIRRPELRLWPTHDLWSFRSLWVWGWIGMAGAALLLLGIVDWDDSVLPGPIRWGVGLPLLVGGNGLAWWGVAAMGWRNAGGAMESRATGGPYRWLDHPQYVGDIMILLGWPILANSWFTLLAAAPGIACFLLARIPEERAVRRTFGAGTS